MPASALLNSSCSHLVPTALELALFALARHNARMSGTDIAVFAAYSGRSKDSIKSEPCFNAPSSATRLTRLPISSRAAHFNKSIVPKYKKITDQAESLARASKSLKDDENA